MQRSMFLLGALSSAFASKGWNEGHIPLVEIDISLLADQVGVATADTLDLGQGVHDLLLTLNIGVKETQNELEGRLLAGYERHDGRLGGGWSIEVAVAVDACQIKVRRVAGFRRELCALSAISVKRGHVERLSLLRWAEHEKASDTTTRCWRVCAS